MVTVTGDSQNWSTTAGQQFILPTSTLYIIQHYLSSSLPKVGIEQCLSSWRIKGSVLLRIDKVERSFSINLRTAEHIL